MVRTSNQPYVRLWCLDLQCSVSGRHLCAVVAGRRVPVGRDHQHVVARLAEFPDERQEPDLHAAHLRAVDGDSCEQRPASEERRQCMRVMLLTLLLFRLSRSCYYADAHLEKHLALIWEGSSGDASAVLRFLCATSRMRLHEQSAM